MRQVAPIFISFTLLLWSSTRFSIAQQQDISVQIYYESLCPDSKAFIVQQLYPTYSKLGKYLRVEFKPFGNAKFVPSGNGWNFTCQHGPDECQGNLYQACLLNALKGQDQLQIEAVHCIMADDEPNTATERCMKRLNIENPSYQDIDQCHASTIGENLLHDFGVETNQLQPPHYFIPWITIDNIWKKEDFEAALADFHSFLCSDKLSHVTECK